MWNAPIYFSLENSLFILDPSKQNRMWAGANSFYFCNSKNNAYRIGDDGHGATLTARTNYGIKRLRWIPKYILLNPDQKSPPFAL